MHACINQKLKQHNKSQAPSSFLGKQQFLEKVPTTPENGKNTQDESPPANRCLVFPHVTEVDFYVYKKTNKHSPKLGLAPSEEKTSPGLCALCPGCVCSCHRKELDNPHPLPKAAGTRTDSSSLPFGEGWSYHAASQALCKQRGFLLGTQAQDRTPGFR